MKKFICIVLLLTILITCALLSGCDSATDKITAVCMIDGDITILPIDFKKAYTGGNFTYFNSDNSLDEIKKQIDNADFKTSKIISRIYGENFIFIEKYSDNKLCYYTIAKYGQENQYRFFSSTSYLKDGDVILTPFHLMDFSPNSLPAGEFYNLELGKEYLLTSSPDELILFYEKIGIFDITIDNNYITIKLKKAFDNDNCNLSRNVISIEFYSETDSNYVIFA